MIWIDDWETRVKEECGKNGLKPKFLKGTHQFIGEKLAELKKRGIKRYDTCVGYFTYESVGMGLVWIEEE